MSGGPGQLLTAVAAAVIGYVVSGGNPMGAAIGFSIGMTAGGIIWPMDPGSQHGPRLADKEVQSSAYGNPIPVIYGSYRTGGNIIWALDIEERADFTRVGKSLFSKGSKVWSYTYFGHFAVALCEGPIGAIGRIWADNKLIYDPETVGKYDAYITKYLGTEEQLPHATIQADQGINATPAFRGIAYVVFDGLPLADFSGRIPTISVEIGGQAQAAVWLDGTVTNLGSTNWFYDPALPLRTSNSWSTYITVVNIDTLTAIQFQPYYYSETDPGTGTVTYPVQDAAIAAFGEVYGGPSIAYVGLGRALLDAATGDVFAFMSGVTSRAMLVRFRLIGGVPTLVWITPFFPDFGWGGTWKFGDRIFAADQFKTRFYCFNAATGAILWELAEADITDPNYHVQSFSTESAATYRASDGSVYWGSEDATPAEAVIVRLNAATGAVLTVIDDFLPSGDEGYFALTYDLATDSLIVITSDHFLRLDPVTLAITNTYSLTQPWAFGGFDDSQIHNFGTGNAINGTLWLTDSTDQFWQYETAGMTLVESYLVPADAGGGVYVDMGSPFHIVATRPKFFGHSSGTCTYKFGDDASDLEASLSEIVSDICERCGLEAADIDVTDIAGQVVPGYGILRESTGRGALEPLLSAYAVDAPEIDGKLHFQFRQTALNATVDEDDLGATGDGGQAVRLTEKRRQEIDLPSAVTVTYSSRALDYQSNTQSTKRIDDTIEAGDPRSQEFPLVLDDTDASTLASRLLFLAWIERTSFSFTLPPKYLAYDPGDVLDVPREDGSAVRVLLTKVELGGDGVVQVDALATDDLAYLPAPDAPVVPIFVTQTVPTLEDMDLIVLDAPLLSDADDTFGYYVGGQGESASWTGGAAYASQDGTTYEYATAVAEETPIGVTTTALADHVSSLIDRTNTVRVVFPYVVSGLASVTELEMLAGANRMMIGAELVGFATVSAIGGGIYDLSVLMRGVAGTEWASSHPTSGAQVVLLDNILSVDEAITGLNQIRYWKGVSLGGTLDESSAETITGTGIRIKPISPVHIAGERDGSNNLDLTWFRRARVDADWRDGVETPLDEPVEAYEIDVVVSSAVVRTLSSDFPAASYSAAEQTADGITPGDPVSVRVYQLSTRVGRGYPGSATV